MIDINELFEQGASDEVIMDAIAKNRAEKEAAQAKSAEEEKIEALKSEARAYLLNAVLLYAQAFDIGEIDEKDITEMEETIKSYEKMIPLLLTFIDIEEEVDKSFGKGVGDKLILEMFKKFDLDD